MRLRRGTWAIVAMVLAGALPAHADSELWFWTEHRQPLPKAASWSPDRLRIWTDSRFGFRYPGLGQQFLRIGPLWELHPNLFVAFHGVGYADQVRPGVYDQEYRLEAEPNLVWALGDWSISDRNRLEYRWRPSEQRWRYRNLLRASWRPEGWRVFPYVWDEVLVDLSGLGLNQNRAMIGLSFDLWKGQRLDVGYGLRSRQGSTGVWDHDHLLNVVWFSNPPVERPGGEGG
jgi:hypothetical protein